MKFNYFNGNIIETSPVKHQLDMLVAVVVVVVEVVVVTLFPTENN